MFDNAVNNDNMVTETNNGCSLCYEGNKTMIKTLKAVLEVAPKKDIRYYLNGVHVTYVSASSCVIEASDGYIAVRLTKNNFDHGFPVGTNVIVSRESLAQALKFYTVKSDATLNVCDGEMFLGELPLSLVDGRYPNLSRIIDATLKTPPCDAIGFNFDILGRLCKACKTITNNETFPVGKFHVRGSNDAMIITQTLSNGDELKAAISPVRL